MEEIVLYFVSNSESKFKELKQMAKNTKYDIQWYKYSIKELQTDNVEQLLRHKVLDAFRKLKRPVMVDHTILEVEAFNSLPGLQANYFFRKMGNEEIVKFCNYKKEWKAKVVTKLCCCTGKKIIISDGFEEGRIVDNPNISNKGYDWDDIFKPAVDNDRDDVYSKLDKNSRSMRKKAWEDLIVKLSSEEIFFTHAEKYKENIEDLAELICKKKVMLFIGAGISASIGLPSWNKLIGELGEADDFDAEIFSEYGDNMLLAEYSETLNNNENRLQDMFTDKWDIKSNDILRSELEKSLIYKYIMELDCPVIYTTNFDHMIEDYYEMKKKEIHRVAVMDDFDNSEQKHPRLMKFHGDMKYKDSIVFTESQYFKRMDYQSFMDIKLQADLLKYNVLFLGYSLSDINIKQLLYISRKRWADNGNKKISYIYTATPNYVQEKVFEKNGIISISGGVADKKIATELFLKDLCEQIKILKKRS